MPASVINKTKLEFLFDEFHDKKILVIGDVMLDSYLWGHVSRISPEAPVPVVLLNNKEYRLGGAANVAANLSVLGVQALLLSVAGNDTEGTELLKLLKQNNISSENILISSERPTTVKSRIIGNNQQQLLRIDTESEKPINTVESEWLKIKFNEWLKGLDAIIFVDYDKGVLQKDIINYISEIAVSKGIPVIVDPKKKNFGEYKNATLFKPNLKELYEGTGFELSKPVDKNQLKKTVNLLFEKLMIKIAMVTLGDEGIFISDNKSDFFIPSHKRTVFDVSGAGDTVVSVAALSLICGQDISVIAELANIAGGLVCEKVGVVPLDKNIFFEETVKLLA